jgi:hypothetical protein
MVNKSHYLCKRKMQYLHEHLNIHIVCGGKMHYDLNPHYIWERKMQYPHENLNMHTIFGEKM